MPPERPIRSEEEIDRLWDVAEEAGRLDVLVTLAEAYEDETEPMPPPDPIEAIWFRLDQLGLTRR